MYERPVEVKVVWTSTGYHMSKFTMTYDKIVRIDFNEKAFIMEDYKGKKTKIFHVDIDGVEVDLDY